jgi:hypothetical protein
MTSLYLKLKELKELKEIQNVNYVRGEVMEVVKAINNDIMPIQISSEEMTKRSIEKYVAINMDFVNSAYSLVPIFNLIIKQREAELGIKKELWHQEQWEKLEQDFKDKYLT